MREEVTAEARRRSIRRKAKGQRPWLHDPLLRLRRALRFLVASRIRGGVIRSGRLPGALLFLSLPQGRHVQFDGGVVVVGMCH